MSSRASFNNQFANVFVGLILLVLAIESGSLLWATISGVGAFGLTFAVSRQWTRALAVGAVVATIISVFGIAAMLSPGWYRGML